MTGIDVLLHVRAEAHAQTCASPAARAQYRCPHHADLPDTPLPPAAPPRSTPCVVRDGRSPPARAWTEGESLLGTAARGLRYVTHRTVAGRAARRTRDRS